MPSQTNTINHRKTSLQAPSMAVLTLLVSLAAVFFSLSSALPSDTVLDASEILSDSGYVSMSLTLFSLASQTLTLKPPSTLTVFAPSDAAFSGSGQPPLSLLRYHFSPLPLSLRTLRSLSAGTEIPTLLPGRNLVVTSSDSETSVNGVAIVAGDDGSSPIFDDGSLIVYGIKRFLDPNSRGSLVGCGSLVGGASPPPPPPLSWLREASESLRLSGYSTTATNLEMQLLGFERDRGGSSAVTVFAPPDQARTTPPESAAAVFLRHAVPCRLPWSDLANLSDGAVLQTFSEGFTITVRRSSNGLRLNGVSVSKSDVYGGESIAVHGLSQIFPAKSSGGNKSRNVMAIDNEF